MRGITGREQVYTAYDGGTITDQQQRDKMLANFMSPKRLVLKEGAQVLYPSSLPCQRCMTLTVYVGHAHQEPRRDARERDDG